MLGIVVRRLSARLGEGLILDLRTAVFDHVQRMPVAFFTRTRTGALVSRLNNDVIGAQRAFSNTLSGVVSNLVTLLLTLAVMLTLSWQITLLALVLLPVFVLPARRMGRRMARMQREAAAAQRGHGHPHDRALLRARRHPGQALRPPARRSRPSSPPAPAGSRDIGVRTATAQSVFITALTLVSALALALVYGLGGWFALRGTLEPGAVVALALLLTRLYAPLTALAGARVEVMSALVSFERVFEVLDLKPLIDEKPDAAPGPRRPGRRRVRRRPLRLPVRRQGLPRLPGGGRRPSTPAAAPRSCTASPSAPNPARPSPSSAPPAPASPPSPSCCPACTTSTSGAVRVGGVDVRDLSADVAARHRRHGHPGRPPLPRHRPRQPAPRPPRRHRGRTVGRPAPRPARPTSYGPCPTASTPSSASAATGSPAANASA